MDGERISVHHGDFSLVDGKCGVFLMIFSKENIQRFGLGEHTLRLRLADHSEVIQTITLR